MALIYYYLHRIFEINVCWIGFFRARRHSLVGLFCWKRVKESSLSLSRSSLNKDESIPTTLHQGSDCHQFWWPQKKVKKYIKIWFVRFCTNRSHLNINLKYIDWNWKNLQTIRFNKKVIIFNFYVCTGDCATMKVLFRNGADITATAEDTGETVLHCILSQQNQGKK
jgi:hypothetical protein